MSQLLVWRHSFMLTQVVPFPENPRLHRQKNDPGVFVHNECWWQLWVAVMHSLMSEHCLPFPVYPCRQWHWNNPMVSRQVALAWQLSWPKTHSSMLAHPFTPCPFPAKPFLQTHVYEPNVSVQTALAEHVWVLSAHSSTLVHVLPFPANPCLHWQVYKPSVFEHWALLSQSWVEVWHSFKSDQKERWTKVIAQSSHRPRDSTDDYCLSLSLSLSDLQLFVPAPALLNASSWFFGNATALPDTNQVLFIGCGHGPLTARSSRGNRWQAARRVESRVSYSDNGNSNWNQVSCSLFCWKT